MLVEELYGTHKKVNDKKCVNMKAKLNRQQIGFCSLLCISLLLTLYIRKLLYLSKPEKISGHLLDIVSFANPPKKAEVNKYYNAIPPSPGVIMTPLGGIGNQLFVYACAYAFAQETNRTLYINSAEDEMLDSRDFKLFKREFALDHFQISEFNFVDKSSLINEQDISVVGDESLLDRQFPRPNAPFIRHSGYCQSEKYWRDIRTQIKRLLRPRVEHLNLPRISKLTEKIRNTESVLVHVRRTDFTRIDGFFMPISYQRHAIRKMSAVFKSRNKVPVFFVVSDHISHAKQKLADLEATYEIVYVEEGNTSLEDFYLMTLSKHFIIPNSSFSWWAAYLGDNPDKVVIAAAFNPRFWHLYDGSFDAKTFYRKLHGTLYHPKEWIVIDPFTG